MRVHTRKLLHGSSESAETNLRSHSKSPPAAYHIEKTQSTHSVQKTNHLFRDSNKKEFYMLQYYFPPTPFRKKGNPAKFVWLYHNICDNKALSHNKTGHAAEVLLPLQSDFRKYADFCHCKLSSRSDASLPHRNTSHAQNTQSPHGRDLSMKNQYSYESTFLYNRKIQVSRTRQRPCYTSS